MPKGYWIANNVITDAEEYEKYKAANVEIFARFGARFITRAGTQQIREGDAYERTVIIEFPSFEAAVECYEDPVYVASRAIRQSAAEGRLLIVEGYEG
jgi:uncharacterized protein (DUF1330 family)